MKKRLAALFCATLATSMILVGCQASKGLETDNLKITQYKGVEVSAADKPEKVTDDDVEQYIQSHAYKLCNDNRSDRPRSAEGRYCRYRICRNH